MASRRALVGVVGVGAGLAVQQGLARADEGVHWMPGPPATETAKDFPIPVLGFGTAALGDFETTYRSVLSALEAGYRHLDTALLYCSHTAIAEAVKKSGIPREELFITTKVAFYPERGTLSELLGYPAVLSCVPENSKGSERAGLTRSLKELDTKYVDLCLVHNPCTTFLELWTGFIPHYWGLMGSIPLAVANLGLFIGGLIASISGSGYEARKASWLEMEKLQAEGLTKAIGVSNYTVAHLEEMKKYATVKPAVNQLELHPLYPRSDIVEYCQKNGIVVTAYGHHVVFPKVQALPEEDRDFTSTAPLVLKWITEQGVTVIPRSSNPQHIRENMLIFGWSLSPMQKAMFESIKSNTPHYWNCDVVPSSA
eukprot:TRINITY_DN2006_c0_g8_i1.p1 TRINITY_DN2006_c0_g8~~TRINITY_DN2006_c0_g8_i1.p1  ORF type:complete len:369 (+),score=136.06 TRINITY_DN2006_c0_g8_i1:2-1108(+)